MRKVTARFPSGVHVFGHRAGGSPLPRLHLFQLPRGGMVLVVSQSADGVRHRGENSEDAHKRPNKIQREDCWYHRVQGQEHLAERGRCFIITTSLIVKQTNRRFVKETSRQRPQQSKVHAFPGSRTRPASVRKSRTGLFSIPPCVWHTRARAHRLISHCSPPNRGTNGRSCCKSCLVSVTETSALRRRQRKQNAERKMNANVSAGVSLTKDTSTWQK